MKRLSCLFLLCIPFFTEAQTISYFTWDTDPTPSQCGAAAAGPNGISWGNAALQKVTGTSLRGLAPGMVLNPLFCCSNFCPTHASCFPTSQNIDLRIPNTGNVFDVDEIDVTIDYRHPSTDEENAWLFARENSTFVFGLEYGQLTARYPVEDGAGGFVTNSLLACGWPGPDPCQMPADDIWRTLRFTYQWTTGEARIYVDGALAASQFTAPFRRMYWAGATDMFIGRNMDGFGDSSAMLDEAIIRGNVVLPVELSYFEGDWQGNHIALEWGTTQELNGDFFVVEYTPDGEFFSEIGLIQCANQAVPHKYTFRHYEPSPKKNYYRLKQVDLDGSIEYSPTLMLTGPKSASSSLQVWPNPAKELLRISLGNANEQISSISIIDIQSKSIQTQYQVPTNGIEVKHLPAGVYQLKVKTDRQIYWTRFVKQ